MATKSEEKFSFLEDELRRVLTEIPYLRDGAYRRACSRRDKLSARITALKAKVGKEG